MDTDYSSFSSPFLRMSIDRGVPYSVIMLMVDHQCVIRSNYAEPRHDAGTYWHAWAAAQVQQLGHNIYMSLLQDIRSELTTRGIV